MIRRFICSAWLPGTHFRKCLRFLNWNLWAYALFEPLFWWSDQVTILHLSRQLSCHGMCKIMTWSNEDLLCKSNINIYVLCEMVTYDIKRPCNFNERSMYNCDNGFKANDHRQTHCLVEMISVSRPLTWSRETSSVSLNNIEISTNVILIYLWPTLSEVNLSRYM